MSSTRTSEQSISQQALARLVSLFFQSEGRHYSRFTTDKLLDFLKCLDHDVPIRIGPYCAG